MTREEVQEVISKEIDPILALHAGSCTLLKVENNIITVRLEGGCVGCPSSKLTLFNGIIPILQDKFPNLIDVECDFI